MVTRPEFDSIIKELARADIAAFRVAVRIINSFGQEHGSAELAMDLLRSAEAITDKIAELRVKLAGLMPPAKPRRRGLGRLGPPARR